MVDASDIRPIIGVVFAGGRSSRMGAEKGLLPLRGIPLIERVVARLRPQVEKVIISANGDPGRFQICGVEIVPDILPGCGPLGGLFSGLRWAHSVGAPFVLTVACDTPFFPQDLGAHLAQATVDAPLGAAVAHSNDHDHYTFVLHPTACVDELESWLTRPGNRSLQGWLEGRQLVRVNFVGDPDPFFNINEPMDLVRAETWVRAFEKFGGRGMV